MKTIKYTSPITVLGVTFKDVREAIDHAIHGKPKDGVYVGEDSKRYPCFDVEGYATENRYFWNLVFARSRDELEAKLEALKKLPSNADYDKFTEELAPMAYWGGDAHYGVVLTQDIGPAET